MESLDPREGSCSYRNDRCEIERRTAASFGESEGSLFGVGCVGRKGEKVTVFETTSEE